MDEDMKPSCEDCKENLNKKITDLKVEIFDVREKNRLLIREIESLKVETIKLGKYKKLFDLAEKIDPMTAHGAEVKYEQEGGRCPDCGHPVTISLDTLRAYCDHCGTIWTREKKKG